MSDAAASIERLLDEPYQISMRSVRLEGSIGGAIYPAHAESFEKLLSLLDVTMREAKSSKGGGYLMFEESFRTLQRNRLDIEQALKSAVANEEFVLHFQPVLNTSCGQVMSAEALIRWNRPGSGMLGPGSFIEIAETSGLIGPIGEWAIGETCREIRRWIDAGLEFDTINVNVSSVQLRDEHFEQRVDHALAAAGIPAETLTLEVTETALVDHFDEASARLQRLRERGIRILIDDFGTGFASLKYLKMLPIDGIKIDRLFVTELPESNIDQSIVAAVASLAQRSRFKLVAEGVETREQARFLIDQGVTWLQGYLISRPIPATDMRARLKPKGAGEAEMRQTPELALSPPDSRSVAGAS
jgi:EAL domain-containing protein (putative c-di-GMP-specific phosphodiesterase class I)